MIFICFYLFYGTKDLLVIAAAVAVIVVVVVVVVVIVVVVNSISSSSIINTGSREDNIRMDLEEIGINAGN